jgi:hypothetical protein
MREKAGSRDQYLHPLKVDRLKSLPIPPSRPAAAGDNPASIERVSISDEAKMSTAPVSGGTDQKLNCQSINSFRDERPF